MDPEVRAVLKEHCISCHGPEKQKSDIRFDNLGTDLIEDRAAAETWHDALNALHLGEMPPEDEPPISSEDRAILTEWIQRQIDDVVAELSSTGGRVVVRRLNRSEYQNTMVDLLGVDLDYISNLPPDSVSPEGFKNNGAVLSMSPLQLEYYLEAARKGLNSTIVTSDEPEVFHHNSEKTEADKGKGNYTNRLGRTGVFVARIPKFPDEGEFEIRVRARAELVDGKGFPRMKVRFGYRADTQAPAEDVGMVDVTSEGTTEFVFRKRIESFPIQSRSQSKYPGMLTWISNVYDDGEEFDSLRKVTDTSAKAKKKKKAKQVYVEDPNFPKIVIESFEFKAPVYTSWPPENHRRILFDSSLRNENEAAYAREVVTRFAGRAYRRPVEVREVDLLMRFYRKVRPTVNRFEVAMREVLAMALISPDFLYLIEPGDDEKRHLDEFELASRLSYFLWNTMPDEQLLRLAESGQLRDDAVLRKETLRMLKDPRSMRFVEQFTDQWLDLSSVDRVAVNPEYYEDFDTSLKPHMKGETRAFFGEVLRGNLSALNFIDSDFVMLNEPMAKHYGRTDGPKGTSFERLDTVAGRDIDGGLLTQASVLLGNSTGEDSHPILRAVWLRSRLLDDPPAPPPPNVPELDGESPDMAMLSVKEQLEFHREDPSCADCHRGIDPWGIAMENYDAIGRWRDQIRRKGPRPKRNIWHEIPVEAEAELPDGVRVEGMGGLKSYLLKERKEQFGRALTSRLASYALGRSLELTDEAAIDAAAAEFAANGFRLGDLITEIVSSELFHTK